MIGRRRRDGAPPDRPLRVLFVISRLEPGGSEGQLTNLLVRVHPQRIEAAVATLYPTTSRQHLDPLAMRGVLVHDLSYEGGRTQGFAVALGRLPGIVRTLRPDVIYAWLEEAATVAVPVARSFGIPVVVSRRNVCGASFERYPLARVVIRRIEAAATLATANSEAVRDEAIRRGIARDRIRVVLNGHEELPPLPEPAAASVRLGYLAHLRPEKGHIRLLEALERLPPNLDWHADLAGGGPLEAEVRAEVQRRGLADRVSLVGVIEDSRAFWADHHVAVLLSDHEGSSNTLIEAAMAGRPLVATDVAGNQNVVAPGGGLLVPLDDSDAIAATIMRIASDRGLRATLGAQAHEQAVARFSMQQFVDGQVAALQAAVSP